MVKVTLRDGSTIEIPGGKKASFQTTTRSKMVEELVEITLDIKGDGGYDAKLLGSFKAAEVIGFTIEDNGEG